MVKRRRIGPSSAENLYPKRVLLIWPNGRVQVAYQKELVRFEELEPDDYLDTADLQQRYGVSARTIYRWMADAELEPDDKIGRDLYFEKRTVLRWERQNRPKRGRPW